MEHHSFFRLHAPPCKRPSEPLNTSSASARKFLTLNLGSKFRYSGRHIDITRRSKTPEGTLKAKDSSDFARSSTLRKTLPLHLEPVSISDEKKPLSGGVPRLASPETSSIGSSVHSNGGLKPKLPRDPVPKRGQDAGDVTPTNSHQSLAHRAIESFNHKVQSLSSKMPKKAWAESTSDDEGMESFHLCTFNRFAYLYSSKDSQNC